MILEISPLHLNCLICWHNFGRVYNNAPFSLLSLATYILSYAKQETQDGYPWVGKIPWRREWLLTPVFLPGKAHGQGSLAGYSPQGHKKVGYNLATYQQTTAKTKR